MSEFVCTPIERTATRLCDTWMRAYCNTLHHAAPRCIIMHHRRLALEAAEYVARTVTHCNTQQHTATHCNTGGTTICSRRVRGSGLQRLRDPPHHRGLRLTPHHRDPPHHRGLRLATPCNTLQLRRVCCVLCSLLQFIAQLTATHIATYNSLQHTSQQSLSWRFASSHSDVVQLNATHTVTHTCNTHCDILVFGSSFVRNLQVTIAHCCVVLQSQPSLVTTCLVLPMALPGSGCRTVCCNVCCSACYSVCCSVCCMPAS